jgi:ABC-2 type transport system ATP-binding protein
MVKANVVEVKDLRKTYQDGGMMRKKDIHALNGVTFDVAPGQVFGLLGPNGAGKTTFIKVLLGIIQKSGGEATLLGFPAGDRRGRLRVGYLPERLVVPRHHTGRTALEYYGQLSGMTKKEVLARRESVLELVGLAERGDDWARKYSKGMLQRLGLAQALIHDPELLILDEPTDGLDPVGRAQVREILARLRSEGKTIFLNSHLLQEVELICDRVAIMDRGVLKRVGPVDEMTAGGGIVEAATVAGEAKQETARERKAPLLEVELELLGDESLVRQVFGGQTLSDWRVVSANYFRCKTLLDDQPALDRTIDALRQRGISIARINPRRASLEEVFMQSIEVPKQARD